jgi:hypothetical protein
MDLPHLLPASLVEQNKHAMRLYSNLLDLVRQKESLWRQHPLGAFLILCSILLRLLTRSCIVSYTALMRATKEKVWPMKFLGFAEY